MPSRVPATERVRTVLVEHGVDVTIDEFPEGTRTAQEAADAIGTEVGQIVKSLVFVADADPILVLVSGANMADTGKLGALLDAKVNRADARLVRDATGFAIGGVPPVGHTSPLTTIIDEDLLQYDVVYAAAGTPFAVFGIDPRQLVRISGGRVADVAKTEAATAQ